MSKRRRPKKKKHAHQPVTVESQTVVANVSEKSRTGTLIEDIVLAGIVLSVFWLFTTLLKSHFTLPKLTAITLFTGIFLLSHLYRTWRGAVNPLPRMLWLTLSSLAFWWLLGTSQSIHLQTALEGQYGRYNGLYTNIFWLILFLAVARTPFDGCRRSKMLSVVYIASVPVCLYAFVQHFALDPLTKVPVSRPFSSIGNAVSLGAIIMMIIPFALNDLIQTKSPKHKPMLLTLLGLLLLTEMITGSRGTWIGSVFVISIVLLGHKARLKNIRHWLNRYNIVLLVVFIAVPILVINWSALLERFSESTGIKVRLIYFSAALEVIRDNPILGNGFESFRLAYPGYRPIEDSAYFEDVIPTMVHNDYLQLATDNGLPALFFYFAFIVVAIRILARAAFSNPDTRGFLLACIASIVGFLVQALSGWNEVSSSAFFWLMLGLGMSTALSQQQTQSKQAASQANTVIFGASLIFIVFFASTMIGFVKSDYAYRQMLIYQNVRTDQWIKKLDRLATNDAYYQDQIGTLYLKRLINRRGERKNYLNYRHAARYFRKAIELNPFNPYSRLHLMQADTVALHKKYIHEPSQESRLNITELEKMDPNNPTVYETRARLFASMGMMKKGAADLARAKTFPELKR